MDVELMKCEAEEEMEMMLMQMDKLPDFTGTYGGNSDDLNDIPIMDSDTHLHLLRHYGNCQDHHHSFSGALHGDSAHQFLHPDGDKRNSMAVMREMIFRIAAMQPIHIDPESVKPPKRRNVKISTDPQSVAARHRRERISERIRILQRLVPGGTKMDTASMLDEAIHYVKFLKNQVQSLERVAANRPESGNGVDFPVSMVAGNYFPAAGKGFTAEW
ncbi:hypothetical protein M569_10098 [Genlisea aurea]|uniref:BHLH domain-containing protein n=1 Tax=Genlisea aurea TaxID=192259 RepID=S8DXI8_9LAMI|nr:hypothetical protein M569_10098 [Genlisea aurea]